MNKYIFLIFLFCFGCKTSTNSSNLNVISSRSDTQIPLGNPARKMIVSLYAAKTGVFCTATIVGNKTVISATHCFSGQDEETPASSVRPAPYGAKNEIAYVAWNNGLDFPKTANLSSIHFKSKIKSIAIHPQTTPGAMGIVAPLPDIAILCLETPLPKETLAASIDTYDGNYPVDVLFNQTYRFYGFGVKNPLNEGLGVLRQGRGIGVKRDGYTNEYDPVKIEDTAGWLEKLNPFRDPDGGCKGDSGGPVFFEHSGTFAGVISSGHCSRKVGRKRMSGLEFSPVSRIGSGSKWITDAIEACESD